VTHVPIKGRNSEDVSGLVIVKVSLNILLSPDYGAVVVNKVGAVCVGVTNPE